jgi:hypothetical protein
MIRILINACLADNAEKVADLIARVAPVSMEAIAVVAEIRAGKREME